MDINSIPIERQDSLHVKVIPKTHRYPSGNWDRDFEAELQAHLNQEKRSGYHLKKIDWVKENQGPGLRLKIDAIVITELKE